MNVSEDVKKDRAITFYTWALNCHYIINVFLNGYRVIKVY